MTEREKMLSGESVSYTHLLDCIKFKLFVMLLCHMRFSFSMPLLYHVYVYLEFLILVCTIYILAPIPAIYEGKPERNYSLY